MLHQVDHRAWHKINGVSRQLVVSGVRFPGQLRPLVNEYPKSGGSWLAQMLAEALRLPFPRNRLPTITDCVMHGHYKPYYVKSPVIHVCRDGRDVLTSFYFHRLQSNTFGATYEREKAIRRLGIKDPEDVQTYMPRFIELVAKGETHPNVSWSDFIVSWCNHGAVRRVVKYEDMLLDSAKELQVACISLGTEIPAEIAKLIAQKYSFESQSQRKQGCEDPGQYLRKGISGDWRTKFSQESRDVFQHYMGEGLIALGYEVDENWV